MLGACQTYGLLFNEQNAVVRLRPNKIINSVHIHCGAPDSVYYDYSILKKKNADGCDSICLLDIPDDYDLFDEHVTDWDTLKPPPSKKRSIQIIPNSKYRISSFSAYPPFPIYLSTDSLGIFHLEPR